MIPRLYVAGHWTAGETIALPADRAHYLRDVLRLGAGDELRLFNEERGEWSATLVKVLKKSVEVEATSLIRPPVPMEDMWLVFAPIKRSNLEWMVEKATELGANRLVPAITDHTQGRHLNEERLAAIATEAAEQCERLSVPGLAPMQKLIDLLMRGWPQDRKLFACIERADALPLASALAQHTPKQGAVLIGPEGGFSDAEKTMLAKLPFVVPVSLGQTILRAETAALAALATWQQHLATK